MGAAFAVLAPKLESLHRESGRDGADVRKEAGGFSSEVKSTMLARIRGSDLESVERGGIPFGRRPLQGVRAGVGGENAKPEQLGVDVGTLEHRSDLTEEMRDALDAGGEGAGARLAFQARQQAFEKIAVGVQAVHHALLIRHARQETFVAAQRAVEALLPGVEESLVAGRLVQLLPCQRRFQLITTGAGRPARLERERTLFGEPDHRVNFASLNEGRNHGAAGGAGDVEKPTVLGGAPDLQQSADDDPRVEEIRQIAGRLALGGDFEREEREFGVPSDFGEKTRGAHGRVAVGPLAGFIV